SQKPEEKSERSDTPSPPMEPEGKYFFPNDDHRNARLKVEFPLIAVEAIELTFLSKGGLCRALNPKSDPPKTTAGTTDASLSYIGRSLSFILIRGTHVFAHQSRSDRSPAASRCSASTCRCWSTPTLSSSPVTAGSWRAGS